ncbi:MAG: FHA domain-containing protein [Polyangiaceae bacterium]|nr:FHA domain-containing protein [Polyangiaceae bacterium]
MMVQTNMCTPRRFRGRSQGKLQARSVHALFVALAAMVVALWGGVANAAPEARILRIDPRAAKVDDAPILTTVVEVVQNKRLSELEAPCATLIGDSHYSCVADALEKPGALYSSFDFPDKNALFAVKVDGQDFPISFESKIRWSDAAAQNQPGVGTAWLIVVDAASTMGSRFDEAKAVAAAFVNAMGPQDIVDVVFFNDKAVVLDSKWTASKQQAANFINSAAGTYPTQGRTRMLNRIIRNAVTDSFNELGNAGVNVKEPMHQALVVLSNGAAGTDPESTSAGANILKGYITKGRFPEDNTARPKMPVPVISIWFPSKAMEEFAQNSREFMEALANPEIGGFFSIVLDKQANRAANIVNSVRTRFGKMHIVKWRAACVAPTVTQTFTLNFINTNPQIAGDNSFADVPVGIDPTTWPLDIDRDTTEKNAKKEPIFPGGKVRVYGNFCWGGNAQRAELYMVPSNQPAPTTLQGGSLEDIKKAQRNLIESGMRGKAASASDTFAEFEIPDSEKWLAGKGDGMSGRLVIYDNGAKRASPITQDKILTLKAKAAPPPYLLIGGGVFGGVVILLLVVAIFRGGGRRGRGGSGGQAPKPIMAGGPPAPVMAAPPMYGSPMGGPMAGPPPDMGFGGGGGFGPPPGAASRAVLTGGAGIFTVQTGTEMRAGRDGAVCQLLLAEPRVSGTHATLKVEGGQLLVRDENSNNGTFVNGQRIPAMVWTAVPPGAALRFGPAEFSVRLE